MIAVSRLLKSLRDAIGELTDGLHLPCLTELLFGCLPLCQIARDLGKADQPPNPVMDRIDDDMRQELNAVLADPPSLGLVLAGLSCWFQCAFRHPVLPILLGIKLRKMAADNFLGRIAFDSRSAGIPALNRLGPQSM
jgi:hypothetical protein